MALSSAAAPRPLTEAWASADGTICASLGGREQDQAEGTRGGDGDKNVAPGGG
jgi:hypothetical protein